MFGRNLLRIALALTLSASMWFYVQKILIPYQQQDTVANNRPAGSALETCARYALAVMTGLVRHALGHRLPMKLDY